VSFGVEGRAEVISAVAELAHEAFRGCDAASITLVEDGGHPHTIASTHDAAAAIDEQQYESGGGPCLEAIRVREPIRVDSYKVDDRWEAVAEEARGQSVGSSLSLPLVAEGRAIGALNLYSFSEASFSGSEDFGKLFAMPAAIAVAGARALDEATALAHNLALALEHRDVIGQAKGILMATSGVSSDDAFAMLRAASQRRNRKLYEIAEEIVRRRSIRE
jgi:GAF domain-containing protein